MSEPLDILFVDDGDNIKGVVDYLNEFEADVSAELRSPENVTAVELESADLVLLDLELNDWLNETVPALQQPQDGLGLASVVRSYYRESRHVAVALLSDKLERLSHGFDRQPSEHSVARLHNLEWAFDKRNAPTLPDRIVQLAAASRRARELWAADSEADSGHLHRFLALPDEASWRSHAEALLGAAQPPFFDLATLSQGQAMLRWLAQRVLPHPGLLLDTSSASVMLGLMPPTPGSLEEESLEAFIGAARFDGVLATFAGDRWWKSGIQALVADLNGGRPLMTIESIERLANDLPGEFTTVPPGSVVCLDAALVPSDEVVPRHEAVRVRPDDWPVFADPAYVSVASFASADEDEELPRLLAFVDPADRGLVTAGARE